MLPLPEPLSPFQAPFVKNIPVTNWDVADVNEWLTSLGCNEWTQAFVDNHIDGEVLLMLGRAELRMLIARVGDRIRVQCAIERLKAMKDGTSKDPPSARGSRGYFDLEPTSGPHSGTPGGIPNHPPLPHQAEHTIRLVFQDGKTRTVNISGCRNASDIKLAALKLVFPSISKPAVAQWAISRGDRVLSSNEVVQLQNSVGTGTLKIHMLDQSVPEKSTRAPTRRPTSRHVSANLKEYFPNVPSGELEQTVRNSVLVTRRLSTWDRSSRISNIVIPEDKPLERQKSERSIAAASKSISQLGITPGDRQFLDKLKAEEMTPTRWIRGQMIGSGSFGTVYMGMNAFTGELLAVKQVELPNGGIEESRKTKMVNALKHEVHLMREFDHPNIVQYRGFKSEDHALNIFLEYVPGGSLASMLNQYGSFEEALVSHYVRQILSGLHYLHERQVIHRDIKGANILVDDKGNIKISDFGLSKKMETRQLLQPHRQSMQGSTFWMAPEVVKQVGTTVKADIWSLGCLVIELLTGCHPFPQLTQMQAIFKLGNMIKPSFPENVTPEATDFLQKTLEVDPAKRSTASELLKHPFAQLQDKPETPKS